MLSDKHNIRLIIENIVSQVLREEIDIDPKNKGKFTATQKRTGKSTEELCHSKNPLTRKRANFAKMAKRGWKPLKESEDGLTAFEEYEQDYPNDNFDVSNMTPEELAKWCERAGDFLYVYRGLRGLSIKCANVKNIVYDIVNDLYNCRGIKPTHEVDYLFSSREKEFINNYVCIFKVIGIKNGDYYIVYEEDKSNPMMGMMTLDESVRYHINEAFQSNKLRAWFKQHGGVKRFEDEPYGQMRKSQDGLGDVTDDTIIYSEEFGSHKDAIAKKQELCRVNPYTRQRSDWDMRMFFRIYEANDGTFLLVGLDRNKIQTGTTWGGETTQKTANRFWNTRNQSNQYQDDSDTYYYSKSGQYFGVNNSNDFKNMKSHNEKMKQQMSDDDWKDYQDKRVQRIRDRRQNIIHEAINKVLKENMFNNQWEKEIEIFMQGLENGEALVDNGYVAVEWGNDETDPRYIYYKEGEDHLTDDRFTQQNSRRLYWNEISKIRDYTKQLYGVDIYIPDDEYYEEVNEF